MNPYSRFHAILVASVLLVDCGPTSTTRAAREVPAPAVPASAEPSVEAGADGHLYLSWLEPDPRGGHALRFAVWEATRWSEPRTVASGSDWFVNWADFPAVTALDDGTLVAHWLRRTGASAYAYGVRLALSRDGGATWSDARSPHDDSPTEHGFVSKVPLAGGRLAAIWLDGRETAGTHEAHAGPMTLRAALLTADGAIERQDLIDARVCDCCQTAAVRLDDGTLVVAYRDRSENEIRDIAVSRFDGERWSEPSLVHDDGWEISGCPVNGPALDADGRRVAVAWFTAAGNEPTPRVKLAVSHDGGRTFGAPIALDGGDPVGRVDVALLEDGAALVTWIEGGGKSASRILARRVAPDGRLDDAFAIAATTSARASGFPRMARAGRDLLVAWTEAGEPPRIRTALLAADE